jgi:hypothetical protein
MPAESAVKYLRQSNGGQRVDTRCCNFRCQQGRTCKVHQACEVPEPDDEDADGNRAFRYFVVPVMAVFVGWLLWPVVSYFFK